VLLQEMAREYPLAVEAHVLSAMVADEAGLAFAALESARRAYFLAPEEPVTAFLLAICLDNTGDRGQAERRVVEARRGLDRVADPRLPLPHGEGMTALQLRRAIDARFDGR